MDDVRRGDLVTVAFAGDFGKPRPSLVIQSDQFATTATGRNPAGPGIKVPLRRLRRW